MQPVERQVLKIMEKVDVNVRQGTSLTVERFNVVPLWGLGTSVIRFIARTCDSN